MTDFPVRVVFDASGVPQGISTVRSGLTGLEQQAKNVNRTLSVTANNLRTMGRSGRGVETVSRNMRSVRAEASRTKPALEQVNRQLQFTSRHGRGLRTTSRRVRDIGREAEVSRRAVRGMRQSLSGVARSNRGLQRTAKNVRDIGGASRGVTGASTALRGFSLSATSAAAAAGGLSAALTGGNLAIAAIAAAAVFATVKLVKFGDTIATTADEMRLLRARVDTLSGSDKAFDLLTASADRLGLRARDTSDVFSRFAIASQDIGLTVEQTDRLTETVLQLGRISGTASQELIGASRQLGQGLASNRLAGEELRSVMEGLPLVARAIAKDLGVPVGALKQLAEEGKLTAKVVSQALLNASADTQAAFEKLPFTLEQTRAQLSNAIDRFFLALDERLGISKFFKFFTEGLTDAVNQATELLGGTPRLEGDRPQVSTEVTGGLATKTKQEIQREKNVATFLRDLKGVTLELESQAALQGVIGGKVQEQAARLDLARTLLKNNLTLTAAQRQEFEKTVLAIRKAGDELQQAEAREGLGQMAIELGRNVAALETQALTIQQSAGAQARANVNLELSNFLTTNNIRLTKEQAAAFRDLAKDIETTTDRLENAKRANDIFLSARGPLIEYTKSMEALETATKNFGLSTEEAAKAQRDFRIELLETQTTAEAGAERAFLKISRDAEDSASRVEDAFTSTFDDLKSTLADFVATGELTFDKFVQNVNRKLAEIAIDDLFAQLAGGKGDALNQIGATVAGVFGGGGGGGGSVTATDFDIGQFDFASGGSFKVGPDTAAGKRDGVDNRLIAFNARDGEEVMVTPPGQSAGANVSVTMVIQGVRDVDTFRRNQSQITGVMARSAQEQMARTIR